MQTIKQIIEAQIKNSVDTLELIERYPDMYQPEAKKYYEMTKRQAEELLSKIKLSIPVGEEMMAWLNRDMGGRHLMLTIKFVIANHFKTHPEKIPTEMVEGIVGSVIEKVVGYNIEALFSEQVYPRCLQSGKCKELCSVCYNN